MNFDSHIYYAYIHIKIFSFLYASLYSMSTWVCTICAQIVEYAPLASYPTVEQIIILQVYVKIYTVTGLTLGMIAIDESRRSVAASITHYELLQRSGALPACSTLDRYRYAIAILIV